MDSIHSAAHRRIVLAVPSTPLYGEVGTILLDSLTQRGHQVVQLADGDPLALDADLLFLAGDVEHFTSFGRMMCWRQQRPRTILWHMEPLPPPDITPRGEKIGRLLADCTWDKHLPRGLARTLGGWPWKFRRIHYANQFRHEMCCTAKQNWDNVQAPNLAYVVRQRDWLLDPLQRQWIDHLYCTTPPRARYLSDRGIEAPCVQIGYHPNFGQRLDIKRDIDVLFLGSVHKTRRALALERIRNILKRQGVSLRIADRDCFGMKRTRLLNRTKIVVNLVKFPWDFPGMRLLMSAGCGALVVSDTCQETTPFVAGEHFAPASIEEMPAIIQRYLHDNNARQEITDRAYDYVTNELTMEHSLDKILEQESSPQLMPLVA